jgi:formylglycine-generating enzyme required for sulfatase activity
VTYDYQIGKYEVTIGQYTEFLNAVAKTDTYSLYRADMGTDPWVRGIERTGVSGSYSYSVIGPDGAIQIPQATAANRPITYVSWWDSARFANWLANGQPTGAQTNSTTENGAYNLNGATSGDAPARNVTNPNTGATPTFYMPTENEWYKAAYYSPNYGGVGVPGYYTYATQSNATPGNLPGSGANQANFLDVAEDDDGNPIGGFSVTQSGDLDFNQNYLTDVGAFTNSASFYGTFDQSGNVRQFAGFAGANVVLGGGNWYLNASNQSSLVFSSIQGSTNWESGFHGFRLASPAVVPIPEPSTYAMALAGLACGAWQMVRRRRAR